MGVAHLWPKLATAVADEARRIGLAGGGLWAPLSNEASEWDSGMGNGERGRQHKIKAFRKLKASVALTPLLPHPPPHSRYNSAASSRHGSFSVFDFWSRSRIGFAG